MRPAPPADPPAGDAETLPATDVGAANAFGARADRHRRRGLGTVARVAVAAIGLGLVAAASAFALGRAPAAKPGPPTASPGPATPTPIHQAFAFTRVRVRALAVRRGVRLRAANSVGVAVKDSLTRFYDLADADPASWRSGVPDAAWDAFAPELRDRARHDASSLALGSQVPSLRSFTIDSSDLVVSVLVDPGGHAQAAVADVTIDAEGRLQDGARIVVSTHASFLLRRLEQRWLITGYPTAGTTIDPAPTPVPSAGPSAGPSTSATAPAVTGTP